MGGVKLEYLQPERHLHGESAPSGGVKPGSRRREPSGGCSIYRRERENRAAASRVSTVSTFKLHFSPFSTRQSVFGHSSGRVFMNVMYESKCQPRMTRARVSRERWGERGRNGGPRHRRPAAYCQTPNHHYHDTSSFMSQQNGWSTVVCQRPRRD